MGRRGTTGHLRGLRGLGKDFGGVERICSGGPLRSSGGTQGSDGSSEGSDGSSEGSEGAGLGTAGLRGVSGRILGKAEGAPPGFGRTPWSLGGNLERGEGLQGARGALRGWRKHA